MNDKKQEPISVRRFVEQVLNQFDVILKMTTAENKEEIAENLILDLINSLLGTKIDFKKKHLVRILISEKGINAVDEIAIWEPISTEIIPNIITFETSDAVIISADIPSLSLYDVITLLDDANEEFVVYFGQMYTYRYKLNFKADVKHITKRRIAGRIEIIIPKMPY